ncbi:TRAP transporter small permease [Azospirillum doebereinerae]|uniref:TRAP transporter small permease n=1 Tax=Azospirillum doebereinerae TaxID=92933 RepID=UPI00385146C7
MASTHHAPAVPGGGAATTPHRWATVLDGVLGPLVEIPAALLVVAEIVVLLAGVVSRYLLHSPLVWSDELASILFLWLAMLGSVVAFRRGGHMRMTALVGMASPRMQAFLEAVAIAAPLAFLLLVIGPSIEFAEEETFITTPAMELTNAWRARGAARRFDPDGGGRRAAADAGRRLAGGGRCPGGGGGGLGAVFWGWSRSSAASATSICWSSSSGWSRCRCWPACPLPSPSGWRPSATSRSPPTRRCWSSSAAWTRACRT